MPSTRGEIYNQFQMIQDLYTKQQNYKPDVTSGIFGEQARTQKALGGTIAAAGGGVKGTMNYLPLFGSAARFAEMRINARNAAEQAKIMNLMNLLKTREGAIGLSHSQDVLDFEKYKFEEQNTFNLAEFLPKIGLSFVNPFGIGSSLTAGEK